MAAVVVCGVWWRERARQRRRAFAAHRVMGAAVCRAERAREVEVFRQRLAAAVHLPAYVALAEAEAVLDAAVQSIHRSQEGGPS